MSNLMLAAAVLQDEGVSEGPGLLAGALGLGFAVFMLAFAILMVASTWVVFTKAGKPGWACLVPIYNIVVLLDIVGKPIWWIVLLIIPFVNFIAGIMVTIALAEKFSKGAGFGVGLVVLPFVFFPLLAFGDAQYRG